MLTWVCSVPGKGNSRMFKVGDCVIYPQHGAAVVEGLQDREIGGETREYLVLKLTYGDLTLMVPRDNCQEVGIREVCSSDDVEGVLEILRTGECSTQGNWSRRFKGNIERLQSGDIFQVAEVVRDLTVRDRDKGLSAGVAGGPIRRASVAAGLDALPQGPAYVAVHDACRPLLRRGAIDRLAGQLDEVSAQGVAPGVAVTDTVRRVAAGDRSGGIVHREELRTLQTPQVFLRAALLEAHRRAAAGALADPGPVDGGSDAVLLERAGFPVAVVPGEPENLTIATALDLEVAEVLAARAAWPQAAR